MQPNIKTINQRKSISIAVCIYTLLLSLNDSVAQSTATVYTPNGTSVTVLVLTELTPSQISSANAQAATTFPNATIVNNSSAKYNCHAYAWYLTECSGCTKYWMNSPGDDKYWQDCSYIEVSASDAQKISYASDDHSAVKSVVSGKYDSKWGQWPVMRHSPTYTPYNSTNLKYYLKPSMSGPSSICTIGSFNVTAPSGATVTWSVTPSYAATFPSGSGTSKTFTRSSTYSGNATISAVFSDAVGGCGNITVTKTVRIGPAISYTWSRIDTYGSVQVNVSGGQSPWKWYLYGSTLIATTYTPSATINFGCNPGSLEVRSTTSCGLGSYFDIIYNSCSSPYMLTVYPNPASSQISVSELSQEATLSRSIEIAKSSLYSTTSEKESLLDGTELILMDFNGQVLFRKTNPLKNTETIDLDISLYDKGIYFLRIVGKNLDETHKIVIE